MISIFFILSTLHTLFYLTLTVKWRQIPFQPDAKVRYHNRFSIVLPVRNEEENIRNILSCLEKQSYPKDLFEVIVVDDFSSDRTAQIVREKISSSKTNVQLLSLSENDLPGKKNALTKGIDKAGNEIVLTTDADCQVLPSWIEAYDQGFDADVQMIAGPVMLEGKGLFSDMQKVEFAGLVAFGAVTLESNNPSMCSGANLGFRKSAFEQVGGYSNNIQIPTGDDEFLLYDILNEFPSSGKFLKSKEAVVKTKTHLSFYSFFNQRSRWISKWKHNKNWKLRVMAVLFFFDYLLLTLGLIATINGTVSVYIFSGVFFLRFISNYFFVGSLRYFLTANNLLLALFLLQIFYPVHVLFMGLLSIFGRYTWKGRRY